LETFRRRTGESEGRFLLFDDIFDCEEYPSLRHLSSLDNIQQYLSLICEIRQTSKSGEGRHHHQSFRLEDDRVMKWLKQKVQNLVSNFGSIKVLVDSIAYTESLPEACRSGMYEILSS